MLLKKGAMFGLDARIALAIFGALSVISGAALYSAIQDAKATALLVEMQEIGKAWEQYYFDTESPLSFSSNDTSSVHFYRYNVTKLVSDPGINRWNGPYLTYSIYGNGSDFSLVHPIFGRVYIMALNGEGDWGENESYTDGICIINEQCFAWAYISSIPDISLKENLDRKIDGGDGSSTGRVKWVSDGNSILYKLFPITNPFG